MNRDLSISFLLGLLSGAVIVQVTKSLLRSRKPKIVAGPFTYDKSLSDLLQNTSAEFLLVPKKSIIVVEYRSSIDNALMLMEENNLVSIPVVDLEKRRYVGMLNVLDVVSLSTTYATKEELVEANVSVAEVLKGNREPFLPLYATSPLSLLLHVMSTLANEVPIMGGECQITNMVTRHDVLRFLQENIDALGPRVDAPVHAMIQLVSPVSSILPSTKVVDAIKLMAKTGVTELAVISPKEPGVLLGNLVVSDFRRLSVYNFSRIQESVSLFIAHDPDSFGSIETSTPLRLVIHKFVETKLPAIWVVDSANVPIGCITLKTIMKVILDEAVQQ